MFEHLFDKLRRLVPNPAKKICAIIIMCIAPESIECEIAAQDEEERPPTQDELNDIDALMLEAEADEETKMMTNDFLMNLMRVGETPLATCECI